MGSTLKPMHFIDSSGQLAGFEVDLVNLYAQEQNLLPVYLDPAKLSSTSIELVVSGKADMAVNCIAITDERKKSADFSNPYFSSGTALLTNRSEDIIFYFFDRTYLVIKNSLYAKQLAEKSLGNRKEVNSIEEALAYLENEKLKAYRPYAFAFDWTALQHIADEKKNLRLQDFVIAKEEYGAAFRRGTNIRQWNLFLAKIEEDGRYRKLVDKWFSGKQMPWERNIGRKDGLRDDTKWSAPLVQDRFPAQHVLDYLPILNSELRLNKHGSETPTANLYYNYLLRNYNKTWLPHLEELYFKGHPFYSGTMFFEFIAEKNITDMLPTFYQSLDTSGKGDLREVVRILAVLAAKNPTLRNSIEKTYDQHLEPHMVHVDFTPGVADGNSSEIRITLIPDKKPQPVTITISMGHDGEIKLLPGRQGATTRLMVNGISGTLKKMTVSGPTEVSIVNIEKGVVGSYSLPDYCSYAGMSDDGKTMYLDFLTLRLFLDVGSDTITRIELANPLRGQELLDYASGKAAGLGNFKAVRSGPDTVYYLESGDDNRTTVYKKTGSSPLVKLPAFLGDVAYPVILDGKLFSSNVGYDACTRLDIVDLETGLKLDTGYCGGIVPVGAHEIYYCAQDGHWIINSETLQRKPVKNLPCLGNTGSFAPHPLPGYFVYFEGTMC